MALGLNPIWVVGSTKSETWNLVFRTHGSEGEAPRSVRPTPPWPPCPVLIERGRIPARGHESAMQASGDLQGFFVVVLGLHNTDPPPSLVQNSWSLRFSAQIEVPKNTKKLKKPVVFFAKNGSIMSFTV